MLSQLVEYHLENKLKIVGMKKVKCGVYFGVVIFENEHEIRVREISGKIIRFHKHSKK